MKVKLTLHMDYLVIDTLDRTKDEDFRPIEAGYVGCSLKNTGKHLGISEEALMFIKALQVSGDDIGFIPNDNTHHFSWLGPPCRLVTSDAELPNSGFADIDFIKVPNVTNSAAIQAVDYIITADFPPKG